MKKLSLFLILTLFGFTAIGEAAQSKGAAELTAAPNLVKRTAAGAEIITGPSHNARLALAPYAQVVPNASYTFIGVSHPSLATAHTSIGLVIEAMGMTHPTQQAGNGVTLEMQRAVAFTIDAGQTHRIFIVNEGHAVINSLNAAINDKNTHIIETKSDENQFGSVRVTSVGTEPNHKSSDRTRTGGRYQPTLDVGAGNVYTSIGVHRYDNLNQLAMWGVVYQESNGAGFSLEFIGDMHDSSSAGTNHTGANRHFLAAKGIATEHIDKWHHPHKAGGHKQGTGGTSGVGRGLN